MTGLAHDLPFLDVVLGGRRGKAVAQAVGPVIIGVHAHEFGIVLDEGNGLIGDPRLADMVAHGQAAEGRTRRNIAAHVSPIL